MAEKITFESKDQVPKGLQGVAAEKDGKYVVEVVAATTFNELATKNRALSEERDSIVQRVQKYAEVIGPEEKFDDFKTSFEEMKALKSKVDTKALIEAEGVEATVNARVGEMESSFKNKITALETNLENERKRADTFESQFKSTLVDGAVTSVVTEGSLGARTEALPDILSRARQTFKVDKDNNVRAFDEKGNVRYGSNGSDPLTPKEWLAGLRDTAPYFFKESEGGGAGGSGSGGSTVRSKADLKDVRQKTAYIAEHGQEAYLKLPASPTG